MSTTDTYYLHKGKDGECVECIELVESFDDDGWYAHHYDFRRKDHSTRVSKKIYRSRSSLVAALDAGNHRWENWS